ncbi:MAG: hypothetical protein ACWGMZ_05185 [Thermoguttaceae bacterium]
MSESVFSVDFPDSVLLSFSARALASVFESLLFEDVVSDEEDVAVSDAVVEEVVAAEELDEAPAEFAALFLAEELSSPQAT